MATLVLVRHGQASLGSDDYDRLSRLGREQSKRLGRYWAETGIDFDAVHVGPLRRHLETHAAIAEGYQSCDLELPQVQTIEALCEHQAIAVMERVFGEQGKGSKPGDPEAMKAWFREFDTAMRRWIGRQIQFDDLETWQDARARVDAALEDLQKRLAPGSRALAVTSGGFVCMAIGAIQGLNDIEVYEMSLKLRNSAWTEIRFAEGEGKLEAFNMHPHLSEPEFHTVV
ncbi:MAG: histidine phosphatase family protein [Xanthomonadales bacterium]|nr:histidine phosphatase family protein [Xanthomonadales bacterium]